MRLSILSTILIVELFCVLTVAADAQKIIVGATEEVFIGEENLKFIARIDTGAKTSSIDVENIHINPSDNPVGKSIEFEIRNKQGKTTRINTIVDSLVTIRTAEGSEQRYKVMLTVTWQRKTKNILFTLNDRSEMQYAMLLGRNWLKGNFVVDVEKNNTD